VSIELIDLVLVADRAQAVGFLGPGMAVEVAVADADSDMTLDVVMDPGIETLPSRCMIVSARPR